MWYGTTNPSTVHHARKQLDKEQRKEARKNKSRATSTPAKPDRRQRAQHFLREQLARGAKPASDVEEAAVKAHVDPQALEQARGDLGIAASRANADGVQAVQWEPAGLRKGAPLSPFAPGPLRTLRLKRVSVGTGPP